MKPLLWLFGGGSTHEPGQAGPSSYFYYHPWGFSSQAAHWALMATWYQAQYATSEADLGRVAMQLRDHARSDPNSVMPPTHPVAEGRMTEIQQRPPRTLGPIHDSFWVSCDKGELRIQQCSDCGHYTWPAVAACEACGSEGLVWQAMSGRGRLVSWCSFERDYYGGMLPMPWDTILVELEEGPLFLSNPHGFSCEQAQMGMPLRVAFISCSDRNGTFQLPVFERA